MVLECELRCIWKQIPLRDAIEGGASSKKLCAAANCLFYAEDACFDRRHEGLGRRGLADNRVEQDCVPPERGAEAVVRARSLVANLIAVTDAVTYAVTYAVTDAINDAVTDA